MSEDHTQQNIVHTLNATQSKLTLIIDVTLLNDRISILTDTGCKASSLNDKYAHLTNDLIKNDVCLTSANATYKAMVTFNIQGVPYVQVVSEIVKSCIQILTHYEMVKELN